MFNVTFKDGVDVTITDSLDVIVNSGSYTDIEFNNAVFRNDSIIIFNTINNRLGGVLSP